MPGEGLIQEGKMIQCDTCTCYVYDDDYEEYVCEADMDADDLYCINSVYEGPIDSI